MKEFRDRFQIQALRSAAPAARIRVREAAVAAGLPQAAALDLEVAVGEAISNAILYGSQNGKFPVSICSFSSPDRNAFTVEISDCGPGFDPASVKSAFLEDVGGRGLAIMRALVDEVRLIHDGSGMVVSLVKKG